MARLEAGEAADRESKINLLRLNKLILVVPGRGKAGGWGGSRHRESKINLLRLNKLILVVPGRGKAGGWGGSRQGIQNQFVEAQQIDFGGSGPWEGWRLGRQQTGNPKSIC